MAGREAKVHAPAAELDAGVVRCMFDCLSREMCDWPVNTPVQLSLSVEGASGILVLRVSEA